MQSLPQSGVKREHDGDEAEGTAKQAKCVKEESSTKPMVPKIEDSAAASPSPGVCSLRVIPSFPDMTDTLTCLPSMSQTPDVTTPVMETPSSPVSIEPGSQSSQVCMLTACAPVV